MLTDALDLYLDTRRAMGYELRGTEKMLRSFAAFATERGDTHIRTQTAVAWASRARTSSQSHYLVRRVVLFARHARAEDPRHEVPPDGIFCQSPRRPNPYIYSPEEVERLLAEAGRLEPADSLRPHTFSALFALLFATGLRISEALALRYGDISDDGLVVRKAKFRKTRFVPLHPTARDGLRRYLARRKAADGLSDHVFIDLSGGPLRYRTVRTAFVQMRVRAGLVGPSGRARPRIHDIRHTFAVRALETSPDGRDRIGQHMLALSTYLGHGNVADTYWYLQATPRLMHDIADVCEALFTGVTQ